MENSFATVPRELAASPVGDATQRHVLCGAGDAHRVAAFHRPRWRRADGLARFHKAGGSSHDLAVKQHAAGAMVLR